MSIDPLEALNNWRKGEDHQHCWHMAEGPLLMQVKDGHLVQCCCKCQALRQIHRAHAYQP